MSGVDFSHYKPNTIHRRTLRRMVILKLDSLNKYAQYLKEHPEEANKLFDDVLIPVTSWFTFKPVTSVSRKEMHVQVWQRVSMNFVIQLYRTGRTR